MKQRLCIGIQKLDHSWQLIFNQIGLWVEQIDYQELALNHYSVIILNEKPNSFQKEKLILFIAAGGSILEHYDTSVFHFSGERVKTKKGYLLNQSNHAAFQHISFIDLYSTVYLQKGSDIFDGLIQFSSVEKGFYAYLGFNLPKLLAKSGYKRKRFFNPFGANPDEITSTVSKHELLQIFENILKELHFKRDLPFIKKWHSPSKKPVFCFRVDSDFGDQESINKLKDLAAKYDIPATWFLHVQAHEEWLNQFKDFGDQEIALHGYEHGASASGTKVFNNIQKGYTKLNEAGFNVKGFCAPYGIWNKALMKSLSKMNFIYSSEFTFAYDGIPIQPDGENLPLQIPIHPICTGSLNKHHMNISEMNTYFDFIINNKLSRFESVLLYHHPMQTGIECVEHIFKKIQSENLEKLSFETYASYWKSRDSDHAAYVLTENGIEIEAKGNENHWLYIASNHDEFDLVPHKSSTISSSEKHEFKYMKQYLPEPDQVKELRKRDLKLIKTIILDWKNRIKL